jgi:hypothetical protein
VPEVALWFLIVDTISGRPFYTPALLGSAVFWAARSLPGASRLLTVIGYSMIHVIAFWLVGSAAAALAALVDEVPATLFLVVIFFAIFEVGFYILVATVAQSLLGALAWINVAIGNGSRRSAWAITCGGLIRTSGRRWPRTRWEKPRTEIRARAADSGG